MASDDTAAAAIPRPSIFLSYATQDREAARSLQGALSSLGLEVWLDESELGGGEAWDQKIRKQIRECQFFMPVVSAQTESRTEGYFRREWRLAVERTLDMADDHLFLLPVTIDDTDQARARVPEKFLAVQWLKLPGGRPTPALEALCRRIATGQTAPEPPRGKTVAPAPQQASKQVPAFPSFPARAQQDRLAYGGAVAVWGGQTVRAAFLRLPRWVQIMVWIWLAIGLVSRFDRSDHEDAPDISPANVQKIKQIAQQYEGNSNKSDIAKLGVQIAREFAEEAKGNSPQTGKLLAIPFLAPPGDAAAAKFADSAFAMVYGRLSLSRHGHVALSDQVALSTGVDAAVERGRAEHAAYVLFGAIERPESRPLLVIKIASVEDKSILWTKSYPQADIDTATIAADVDAKVPSLDD